LYSVSAEKSLPIVWIVYGIGASLGAAYSWLIEGRSEEEEERDKDGSDEEEVSSET